MLINKLEINHFIVLLSICFLSTPYYLRADYSNYNLLSDTIRTEEISISRDNAEIFGSLVYPDTDHQIPLVIIISGSGPTDRDGNQQNLKNDCFKLMAAELAKNEIASFRFDKRGIGASHKSNTNSEDLRIHHFVDDIKAWIKLLSDDDKFSHTIVAGHSLGSLMGILAVQSGNTDAFVSLAGPGKSLADLMYDQLHNSSPFLAKGAKPVLDSLKQGLRVKEVHPLLANLFPKNLHDYLISVFQYDPSAEIAKLETPVLIVQGTHDIQIPVEDAHILNEKAKYSQVAIIDSMNHVLKNSKKERTQNIAAYSDPTLPVNSKMIDTLVKFILELP